MIDTIRQGASNYSSYSGKILVSHIFGWNLSHSFRDFPDDSPEDITNGPYWKRHTEIDNTLSTMFMFLPAHLRLPRNFRDQNAIFVNLNLHSSTICLHRAAVAQIMQHDLPEYMLQRSKDRLPPAAEEILIIIRAISHIDGIFKNPFVAFSAYTAASVFMDDFRNMKNHQSENNLEFLLNIMVAAAKQNSITRSLATQLAFDMKRSGIDLSAMEKVQKH